MFDPRYDPLQILEQLSNNQNQLDHNQKQIIMAINQWQKTVTDHEHRLDLNQESINQMLKSLQNQYQLLMALYQQIADHAVNTSQGPANDQTTDNNQKQ
jgi:uncharacterized protein Yka (UPF0111/DUF47 family)